jgi:hypothetical protein
MNIDSISNYNELANLLFKKDPRPDIQISDDIQKHWKRMRMKYHIKNNGIAFGLKEERSKRELFAGPSGKLGGSSDLKPGQYYDSIKRTDFTLQLQERINHNQKQLQLLTFGAKKDEYKTDSIKKVEDRLWYSDPKLGPGLYYSGPVVFTTPRRGDPMTSTIPVKDDKGHLIKLDIRTKELPSMRSTLPRLPDEKLATKLGPGQYKWETCKDVLAPKEIPDCKYSFSRPDDAWWIKEMWKMKGNNARTHLGPGSDKGGCKAFMATKIPPKYISAAFISKTQRFPRQRHVPGCI